MIFRMKIEKLEPSKSVIWSCHGDHAEWVGTTLTWTIAGEGGLTVFRFTHSGFNPIGKFRAMCNSTWGELMYRLKAHAEGKNPGPH